MAIELAMPKPANEPQVIGPEFSDQDRITDILSMEKHLSLSYPVGLNEMQNPKLREVVKQILTDTQTTQAQIFDLMFEKGWYKMKVAEKQEVEAAKTQFTNYNTQLPKF